MYEDFKSLAQEKFPKTAFMVISMDENKTIKTFAIGPAQLSDGDMIGMAEIGKSALLHRMFSRNTAITDMVPQVSEESIDANPEYAS